MRAQLGYDRAMRHWTLVFALSLPSILAASAHAQANGVPPSVTSFGFGGQRDFGGVPPSVTSVGPKGPGPVRPGPARPVGPGRTHRPPFISGSTPGRRHHDHNQMTAYPYFIPYYPVVDPYAYGGPDAEQGAAAAGEDAEDPEQYQGGPTIFDRRGTGTPEPNDYARQEARVSPPPKPAPAPDPPEASVAVAPERPQAPVASQPDTILVFKDGHKQQVGNYAIVGTNLFDLTPGRRKKISLGELDLPATQKANDDQGIDFKLPELPGGN